MFLAKTICHTTCFLDKMAKVLKATPTWGCGLGNIDTIFKLPSCFWSKRYVTRHAFSKRWQKRQKPHPPGGVVWVTSILFLSCPHVSGQNDMSHDMLSLKDSKTADNHTPCGWGFKILTLVCFFVIWGNHWSHHSFTINYLCRAMYLRRLTTKTLMGTPPVGGDWRF